MPFRNEAILDITSLNESKSLWAWHDESKAAKLGLSLSIMVCAVCGVRHYAKKIPQRSQGKETKKKLFDKEGKRRFLSTSGRGEHSAM